MTPEHLRSARREYWRQDGNPVLTSADARAWFDRHPLSLFLPRQAQFPAPAPSFVEAVEGRADPTPSLSAAANAGEILAGLLEDGTVIALNLLGGVGEQPDFLAQTEILPFLASLRGDRDWKQAPASAGGSHVSPLMLELWTLLERDGPATVAAAREKLGRELTESAVLRALSELWQRLRAIPVLQTGGRPAVWELVKQRHSRALATGSGTSQVTAISLLVSTYLQSVYAASGEEIEVFLSPLVSRSRIREAVRGLSATRQTRELSMETQTYYFLDGGLPELAPVAAPEEAEAEMAAAVGGSAMGTAAGPETRQQVPKLTPSPSAAAPLRTNFRPAAGRDPALGRARGVGQRSSGVPDRSRDRSQPASRDRSSHRPKDRSRGGFAAPFRDRTQDRSSGRSNDRTGDRSRDRMASRPRNPFREVRESGEYRPSAAESKGRSRHVKGRETTGAMRRPPRAGWDSPRGVPSSPGREGKWRRFTDPSEQDRPPRYQGARDRTRRGETRQGDFRNNQRNEGRAHESGKPFAYGGGGSFRKDKPQRLEDRPKSSGGFGSGVRFGSDAGFVPEKSRRKFDPTSRKRDRRGPDGSNRESGNPEPGHQERRWEGARSHGEPTWPARRGARAPGGFARSKPNRDPKKPQGRGSREEFTAWPKWQRAGDQPRFGPRREAASREKGPSGTPAPGGGRFAPKKSGPGKFQRGRFGSRPPDAGNRPESRPPQQPGIRGKKTQASFRGKKWPKKKPEA